MYNREFKTKSFKNVCTRFQLNFISKMYHASDLHVNMKHPYSSNKAFLYRNLKSFVVARSLNGFSGKNHFNIQLTIL